MPHSTVEIPFHQHSQLRGQFWFLTRFPFKSYPRHLNPLHMKFYRLDYNNLQDIAISFFRTCKRDLEGECCPFLQFTMHTNGPFMCFYNVFSYG